MQAVGEKTQLEGRRENMFKMPFIIGNSQRINKECFLKYNKYKELEHLGVVVYACIPTLGK